MNKQKHKEEIRMEHEITITHVPEYNEEGPEDYLNQIFREMCNEDGNLVFKDPHDHLITRVDDRFAAADPNAFERLHPGSIKPEFKSDELLCKQQYDAPANPTSIKMKLESDKYNHALTYKQQNVESLDLLLPKINTTQADNLATLSRSQQPELQTSNELCTNEFYRDANPNSDMSSNSSQNHLCVKTANNMSSCDKLNKPNSDKEETLHSANERDNASIRLPALLSVNERTHTNTTSCYCDQSDKTFKCLSELNIQNCIHPIKKPYNCDVCKSSISQNSNLKEHVKTHTGENPYSCNVCKWSFSMKSYLKRHMRTHTGEKPYSCDLCESIFTSSSHLKTHMRTHTGEKPYRCDLCESSFSRSNNLKTHMRTHTREKPYSCDLCESSFITSSDLKRHMRVHTREKPYSCDLCESSFTTSTNLKTHIRIHTGEKPYRCDLCESSFSQSNNLKTHMRTHTREKPYSCDLCESSFRLRGQLIKHMMVHTT